jgi:hypothetical protein
LQALGSGLVGTLSIASRDGDLGYAGVLAFVVAIVDVSWQAQQPVGWCRVGRVVDDRIVGTLVGDHRGRNGDLPPPLPQLHDQWEISGPGNII